MMDDDGDGCMKAQLQAFMNCSFLSEFRVSNHHVSRLFLGGVVTMPSLYLK